LGDHAEGLALAPATDHHRDLADGRRRVEGIGRAVVLALKGRRAPAEHGEDDLQGLFEPLEAIGEGAELDAEGVVFQREPSGADAELSPPPRDDVERREGLGQDSGVAVGVAGDQRAQPNGRRLSG